MSAHPEHAEEFLRATLMFIPELESLLDGNGDTAYITSEHVERFKSELDWFASKASPALREDIEMEKRRFLLEKFVGMTMNEAWDYINSKWITDMTAQPIMVSDPIIQPTLGSSCTASETLIPDSNGERADYMINGVYLEGPASPYFEINGIGVSCILTFTPFTGISKQWNPSKITVDVWKSPIAKDFIFNPNAFYPAESIVWKSNIQNGEFEGVEFIESLPNLPMEFHALQYSKENQLVVEIRMQINEGIHVSDGFDYFTMINERYAYFQHMVDSLHIQKS